MTLMSHDLGISGSDLARAEIHNGTFRLAKAFAKPTPQHMAAVYSRMSAAQERR